MSPLLPLAERWFTWVHNTSEHGSVCSCFVLCSS